MEEADYASTDSDDEDFVLPDKKEKSDSESIDDDEIDNEHEDGKKIRRKKLKKLQSKETLNKNHESISETIDLEQKKRREEELWAAFLGDTEPPKVQSTNDIPKEKKSSNQTSTITVGQKKSTLMEENDQEMWQTKESEFKNEDKVIVQEEAEHRISHTKSLNPSSSVSTFGKSSNSKRPISGLSSVLNQISKKNKLSVLQKTKLDWDGFKSTEGINEELQTHNRGKDGFLERRDFLERTDLRQFEIEKNMRQHSRRSQK